MLNHLRPLQGRAVSLITLLTGIMLLGIAVSASNATGSKPSDGWTLHIDAKKHFPSNPNLIAHHYCKGVAGGLIECQLYDGDAADARLVGIEVVVGAQTYSTFSSDEKALWHYHKTEIPKVEATLPDMSPEEAAKIVKSLEETYGKIYLLWDPGSGNLPVGNPSITILDSPPAQTGLQLTGAVLIALVAVAVSAWMLARRRRRSLKSS